MGISISIKSEIDSRVILYPLMRCLTPLGNILIITSNRQVARVIDGDYDGDFRNFRVLIDTDGATDELLEEAGISPDEYTYVVYDNVGVVEQDKLLIPIGPVISEQFESEMMYLGEDKDTHILRFGTPVRKTSSMPKMSSSKMTKEELMAKREEAKRLAEEKRAAKSGKNMSDEEINDLAVKKFQPKKEDVSVKLKKFPNLKFPTFDNIENFESNKKFFDIDRNFIKFFYTVFQQYIGISEPNFIREVTRKDASSSGFSQKPASGENSIELDAY